LNALRLLTVSLTVFLSLPSDILAQEAPQNTNIAGPSASATGNVTNQAVQILQGPFAVNQFGGGVACSGPSFSANTFTTGNLNGSSDPSGYQSHTGNAGISFGFNIPLDGAITELCKERARVSIARQQAEADKARLDFELVRLLRCGEAMKSGVFFHPSSPFAGICADVVVINTNNTNRNDENSVSESQGQKPPEVGSEPTS
jgi:hypothetical protein